MTGVPFEASLALMTGFSVTDIFVGAPGATVSRMKLKEVAT